MKVIYQSKVSFFRNWNADSSAKITLVAQAGSVLLQYSTSDYVQPESIAVTLTQEEALSVADRINLVLKGEKPSSSEGTAEDPQLIVRYTNDGEPFREGVNLSLSAGDWHKDFSFDMDERTAKSMAMSLAEMAVG